MVGSKLYVWNAIHPFFATTYESPCSNPPTPLHWVKPVVRDKSSPFHTSLGNSHKCAAEGRERRCLERAGGVKNGCESILSLCRSLRTVMERPACCWNGLSPSPRHPSIPQRYCVSGPCLKQQWKYERYFFFFNIYLSTSSLEHFFPPCLETFTVPVFRRYK